jgi:hypothetical protein
VKLAGQKRKQNKILAENYKILDLLNQELEKAIFSNMAHLQLIQQSIFINVRKWNGNFSTMKYAICDCSNKNRVNSQYLTLLQVTLNHGSQTQIYWRARFQGKILRGPQFITKKP